MELSIIIPTYNRKDRLKQCLGVLLNQSYPCDKYEIIIVDDGSTDGTEEAIKNINKPNITYIKQQNKGAGAAINTGVKFANGDILAFTEDDCVVDENWLKNITELFKEYPYAAALVGPCPYVIQYCGKEKTASCKHIKTEKMNIKKIGSYLGNGSFAIRKGIFLEIGGYDENFRVHEDREFNIRLLEKGYDIIVSSKIKADHHCREKIKDTLIRAYRLGRDQAKLIKKHFNHRFIIHFCSGVLGIDFALNLPSPLTIFIKIDTVKILFSLILITFSYPFLYFFIVGIVAVLFVIKHKQYNLSVVESIYALKILLHDVLVAVSFSFGNIVGSIKDKVVNL